MSEATALPFPALDEVGTVQDGGRCRSCQGKTAGRGDLMCQRCWRLVPVSLVALYRLVWRLHHAKLVEAEIQGVLDRVVVREAREADALGVRPRAFKSHATRAVAPATPAPVVPRAPERVTSDLERTLLAVLPTREADAISVPDVARALGRPVPATCMWFLAHRGQHPQLRARNISEGRSRGRWLYWRSDA